MTSKEAGYSLFISGFDLKEIAKIVKVPYATLTKWSANEKWKEKKSDKILREKTNQERITQLIDYQLMVIEKIINTKKKDIENLKNVDELKRSLIDKGDIDALQKLHTTIKAKEVTWDQVVKTIREFIEFIEENDFENAKKIQVYANEFLNGKREQL